MSSSRVTINTAPPVVQVTINPDGEVATVVVKDRVLSKVIFWSFADNDNSFPTGAVEGQVFLTIDDREAIPGGEPFIQSLTIMFAKGTGSDFNDFYYK